MKSDIKDWLEIGSEKYKSLRDNIRTVINNCTEYHYTTGIWVCDIILAFKASGYRIVKDESLIRTQYPDSCTDTHRDPDHPEDDYLDLADRLDLVLNAEYESETKWIYESPDKGKTIFRRPFRDYDTKREQIKPILFDKARESILR